MRPHAALRTDPPSETPFRFVVGWRHPMAMPYCPFHQHHFAEIVYHPSGSGVTETSDGTRVAFTPGVVVVYPPECMHDQTMDVRGDDFCIHLEAAHGTFPPDMIAADVSARPELVADLHALSQLATRPADACACDLRVSALMVDVMALGAGHSEGAARPATHAQKALAMIQKDFARIESVEEIARAVGLSPDRLRHVFRAEIGMGLKQMLLRVRLERAAELLTHSPMPLKAICALCGLPEERHFCTAFRARHGKTPGAYRRITQLNGPRAG